MESTVNQYFGELLKQFSGGINSIGDFAREQIPDVIRQFALYHLVIDVAVVMGVILLIVGGFYLVKRLNRSLAQRVIDANLAYDKGERWTRFEENLSTDTTSNQYDFVVNACPIMRVCAWIVFGVVVLCVIPSALSHGGEMIKIAIAPKIWLIEKAIELGHAVSGK